MMADSRRARIVELEEIREARRGALAVANHGSQVPFIVRRTFLIHEVPSGAIRGGHAHRQCDQFLICASGAADLVAADAVGIASYHLSKPNQGLYVPALTWLEVRPVGVRTVVVVLASEDFDEADYIRDRTEFETLKAEVCP